MEEEIQIQDGSGDKDYFTIVPNYILNHSTAIAQALYLQLKRLAGDKGTAYAGSKYFIEKLGISLPTLRKELKYLLDKKWIEFVGYTEVKTEGGGQKIKTYKITNLWNLNHKHYQRGEKIIHTLVAKGGNEGGKARGEKMSDKEDLIKQDLIKEDSIINNTTNVDKRNPNIDKIINLIKEKFELQILDGTQKENRYYAQLIFKKVKEDFSVIEKVIEIAEADKFWHNKITAVKPLYYNLVKIASLSKERENICKIS